MINRKFGPRRWLAGLTILIFSVVFGAMVEPIAARAGRATLGKTTHVAAAHVTMHEPGGRISFENGFAPIVKQALPAVVSVSSSKVVHTKASSFSMDPFLRQFFGNNLPRGFNTPGEQREHGLGSGVIVSPDGYILTNNHVVDGATEIKVTLSDKREFTAHIVGRDPKTDIAVLKINATGLPVLPLGDSSSMEPGDFVLAIGNPFGVGETVTMGIVSATRRGNLGIEDYEDFIQTDAAINPGNSGGALINVHGQLIGINTAIISGGGGNQGVGFAIPIDMAHNVMEQILKNGKVIRGWLGVMIQPVTPAMAKAFGLNEARGALVADVTPGSPASKSGLTKGDIILDLNGHSVTDSRELSLQVAAMAPGSTVQLTVFRNGQNVEMPVTLGEMPSKTEGSGSGASNANEALSGVTVDELTPEVLQSLQLPAGTHGVVVSNVDPVSQAAEAGLQRGDVIQEVNRKPVSNVAAFNQMVEQAGKGPVLLLVNRGGNTLFLVVQPH